MFWASAGKSNTDFRASEVSAKWAETKCWMCWGGAKDVAHPGMLWQLQRLDMAIAARFMTRASREKVGFNK